MARPRSRNSRAFSLRQLVLLAVLFVTACSSDSCSSGCGGITPIPGGFPNEKRIENAAALRITQQGMDFIEANIGVLASQLVGEGQGILTFDVPPTQGSIDVLITDIDYEICPPGSPAGACTVEIDLANANLSVTPVGPHNIQIAGPIPIRLAHLPIDNDVDDLDLTITGNAACPGENATFAQVQATIELSVETDLDPAHIARYGYSKIRVVQLNISKTDIENSVEFCNGGLVSAALNFFKGFVVDLIFDQFIGTIGETVEEQLCQKSNPMVNPPCPTQTNDEGGICRYPDGSCVPMALGLDGHANLSGLLASISPGTKGGMDFVLAGGGSSPRDDGSGFTWGDLNPIGGGATVGAFGGVEPNPISGCVPLSQMALPSGLKIPNELLDDTIVAAGWPADTAGPHVGIGISESFFNYALNGMYNSGLLCIGISTETIDLLTSDTLGLLAASLKNLALQRESAPVAIVLKPRKPPHVTFGNGTSLETDPLIRLQLEEAGFDFYIWSHDRYIRFMTAYFDIDAPINLTVTPEGLVPVLDKLAITNGRVENADLIKEDPALLGATLQSLLAGQVGSLLGSGIGPIDLNGSLESLGLELVIPPSVEGQGSPGLRTVTKDNERFLGIFAALQVAGTSMASLDTSAAIDGVTYDEKGLRAETITPDNAPVVTINVSAQTAQGTEPTFEVEHQVRVNGGVWKPWQRGSTISVTDETLRIEGRHSILVRSRPVNDAYALDMEPAELEVLIDTQTPEIKLLPVSDDDTARLDVWDLVSRDQTLVRWSFDGDKFTPWRRVADVDRIEVPEDAEEIELEAMDETGKVGRAQQEIIRGAPRGESDGCGCAVPGDQPPARMPWGLGLAAIAGVFGLARRLRRASRTAKHAAMATGVLATGAFSGCSCDDETKPPRDNYKCEEPNCVPLQPGLIGSYTSTAVAEDGTLWVAGYLEGDYDNVDLSGQPIQYGDLVVGKYDGTQINWEIVDGVPTDPPADTTAFDRDGFRGGQTAPGDDVGLWTSIGVVDGSPVIAYYDRTNKALKYAYKSGSEWQTTTVDDGPSSDVGRYASLVVDGGTPTIAYLAIEPSSSGPITSKIKIARGNGADFSKEDAIVNAATPCSAGFCEGSVCVADTGLCTPETTGCDCASGSGEECVSVDGTPTCVAVLAGKAAGYPMATGLYIALAQVPSGGLGLAYYDRTTGAVFVAAQQGGSWAPVQVDGGQQPDGTFSDVGIGLSLFIDSNGWHLTYVDGYNETLRYARVVGGVVQELGVIDDGLTFGGMQHADGLHVIGDDSFVSVTPSGEVHVTYQDATAGKLRYAVGTPSSGGHDWSVYEAETTSFGGFFSSQVTVDGALQLVSWWRRSKERTEGNVSVVRAP